MGCCSLGRMLHSTRLTMRAAPKSTSATREQSQTVIGLSGHVSGSPERHKNREAAGARSGVNPNVGRRAMAAPTGELPGLHLREAIYKSDCKRKYEYTNELPSGVAKTEDEMEDTSDKTPAGSRGSSCWTSVCRPEASSIR